MNKKLLYRMALAGALTSNTITAQAVEASTSVFDLKSINSNKISTYQPHYRPANKPSQTTFKALKAKAKQQSMQRSGQVFAQDAAQNITDFNLRHCVEQRINQLSATYAHEVIDLFCNFQSITSLAGIEPFTGLTFIDFGANQISDLTPLSGLNQLHTAFLWENQITDISPMTALPMLIELDIAFNPLTDISSLTGNGNIERLFIGGSGQLISDLTPLNSLTQLSWLGIFEQQLTNTDFTIGLNNLQLLDLWGNPITDVTELSQLSQLTQIGLMESMVKDIAPLLNNGNQYQWVGLGGNQGVYCWQQDYAQQHMNIQYFDPSMNCDPSTDFDDYDYDGINNHDEILAGSNPFGDGTNPPPPPPPTGTLILDALVHINDYQLKMCIEQAAMENSLYFTHELTALDCNTQHINDVYGIEQFTELSQLMLAGNQIIDVMPLGSLNKLQHLDINFNLVEDISPLASLYQLTEFYAIDNRIYGIAALADKTTLTTLAIAHNRISDFAPISQLTNLQFLDIADNTVMDGSLLNNLTNLTFIEMTNTSISDVSALGQMPQLDSVHMMFNPISDIAPLLLLKDNWETLHPSATTFCWQLDYIEAFATVNNFYRPMTCDPSDDYNDFDGDGYLNIDEVMMYNDPLTAEPPQERLFQDALMMIIDPSLHSCLMAADLGYTFASELTEIICHNQGINNIEGLSQFTGLTRIILDDNNIMDISELSSLSNLETLFMYSNQVSDLSPLSGLTQLQELQLIDNQVGSVFEIASLTNLRSLSLGGNAISDISPLSSLSLLHTLDLFDMPISDISVLANYSALEYLDLSGTMVTDISALSDASNLKHLITGNTNIADISPILMLDNQWSFLWLSDNTYCWQLEYLDRNINMPFYSRPAMCDSSDDFNDFDNDGFLNMDEAMFGDNPFVAFIPPPPVTIFDGVNAMADPNLANCIYNQYMHMLNEPLNTVIDLNCGDMNIIQLDGIEHFSALNILDVYNNHIIDLSPLATLNNLEILITDGNPINDIAVVSQLPNLKDFAFSTALAADISILFNVPNQWLMLSFSPSNYCWQTAWADRTFTSTVLIMPSGCDSSTDMEDYDSDGLLNIDEVNQGSDPFSY